MDALAVAVAAIPGPPLLPFGMNLAPALVPAGIGLAVLAALGAIVLLVGKDARGATPSFRNRGPVITAEKEKQSLSLVA